MSQYNGILIHRSVDGGNIFDVVDSGPYRSLHFDSASIQSRILRSDPSQLVIEYTQAMMLGLAYQPQPKRILLLGLGGGSQARFLLSHYPDCVIDAVELNPVVIQLAQRFFHLDSDERLQIHNLGGYEYLQHNQHKYDLIMVDAFNREGPVESLYTPEAFRLMERALASRGVCVFNSWKDDPYLYAAVCRSMQETFGHTLFDVSLTDDPENIVILIPRQPLPAKQLLRNSKAIQKRTGLKLVKHLNHLAELELPRAG